MTFPGSGWSNPKYVTSLSNESASRQIEDLALLDRWVEAKVKVLQLLGIAKACQRDAPTNQSIIAKQQLILKQQRQEFAMTQAGCGRFVKSDLERTGYAMLYPMLAQWQSFRICV